MQNYDPYLTFSVPQPREEQQHITYGNMLFAPSSQQINSRQPYYSPGFNAQYECSLQNKNVSLSVPIMNDNPHETSELLRYKYPIICSNS